MWVQGTAPRLKLLHIDIHLFRAGCAEDVWIEGQLCGPRRRRDLLLQLSSIVPFDHSEVVGIVKLWKVWHVSPSDIHHQRHAFSSKSLIPCSRSNKPGPSDQVDLYKWEWVAHQDSSHLVMDTLRLQNYPKKSRQWHNLLSTSIFASPFFQKFPIFLSSRLPLLEAI